ncbi:MAG: hypothetical protein ACRDI1_08540 [Actinomycetota bacterium]
MALKDRLEQAKQAASQAVQTAKPQGGAAGVRSSVKEAGAFGKKSLATIVERIDPGLLATVIIKATAAQEKANYALQEKGSVYRISEITITATIPPQIGFAIARSEDPKAFDSTKLIAKGAVDADAVVALDPEVDVENVND